MAVRENPPPATSHNRRSTSAATKPRLIGDYVDLAADYQRELQRVSLSPHTVGVYVSGLRRFLGWLQDADVDGDPLNNADDLVYAVRDWRTWAARVRRYRPATISATLSSLADFARRNGLGDLSTVARPTTVNRGPVALTGRDRLRFDRLAFAETVPIRDRALMSLMRYAGLRITEVSDLNIDSISLSANRGVARVVGKGAKQRDVPLSAPIRAILHEYIPHRAKLSPSEPALILGKFGARAQYPALKYRISRLSEMLGIYVTPHILRHTFATELVLDRGVSIVVVKELLGHEKLETTFQYTRPSGSDLADAVERIEVDR